MVQPILVSKNRLGIGVLALLTSGFLLLPFPYRDAMLLATVGAVVALAWFRPEAVWLVVLSLLPLFRLSGELFHLNGVTVPRLLVVALAGLVVVKVHDFEKLKKLANTNGFRFFAIFILANLISAVSVLKVPAFFVTLTYLEPLLFFAITFYLVITRRLTAREILGSLLLGAALVAVVGLYEVITQQSVGALLAPHSREMLTVYMTGFDSNRFGLGGRVSSLIAQPVFASLYWVIILTVALYFFQTYVCSRGFQIVWACICLPLLVLTATRAGLLALAVALLMLIVLGLHGLRQRVLVVGALLVGSLLIGFLLPNLTNYLGASLKLDPNTNASRNIFWRVAVTNGLLEIFQAHWFLGYGPGMVQKQAQAGEIPKVDGIYPLGGIENQYANILADGGIVAGIAYLMFMTGAVRDSLRLFARPSYRARGVVLLTLFAAYFSFAVTVTTLIEIPNLVLMAVYGAFTADFGLAVCRRDPCCNEGISTRVQT